MWLLPMSSWINALADVGCVVADVGCYRADQHCNASYCR
jgi:hypothetical protein